MKHFKRMLLLAFFAVSALLLPSKTWAAAVEILETGGWFESGYVTWSAYDGAIDYNVYVKASSASDWTQLDCELVRQYPNYYRADALGLKAGDYQFKVEPVTASGTVAADAATSSAFTATAHDRSGFAHVGMSEGIGAYKNDGTLKDDAKVLYVWADNAKTVSTTVKTGSKDTNIETFTGLQAICDAYQKGYDTTPLAIRIIGTIKSGNMDKLSSSEEGLQVKGKGAYSLMPITIEGVGYDAAIHGFGILVRNCKSTEFRNFAIMNCMDDCLSIDTNNSNVWIHNMDFFYGATGGDADQAKGDGTVDIKAHSMNVTVSYNHFYDSGKCSLGGMSGEQTDAWHTYHHNWFDHSDSRHPRIRVQFFHVYNNYYDGNSKYGVGMTSGGSALVENNYFRNCKYPMLTSKQGTDAEGDGTFSGETGGVIKAFNNILVNPRKIQYNTGAMTDGKWDAVLVESRDAEVTATCLAGGTGYNSEADLAARTSYIENKIEGPETVVATVTGPLGAGRMQHGDFTWKFLNSAQDENDKVIVDLKTAFNNYKSTLIGFANGNAVSNGGATQPIKGGDGVGVSDEVNNAHVPSWGTGTIVTDGDGAGGGSGSADPSDAEAAIIGAEGDYFWFNADNEAATNAYIADGTITLNTGSSFKPNVTVVDSKGVSWSDKTGSLQLATSSGTATFYNADGITKMCFYLARTGSMSGKVQGSNDNETYTDIQSYSANKGTYELTVSSAANYKYYRITNTASGSLHVQGIKLYKYVDNTGLLDSDLTAVTTTISLNLGKTRQLTRDDDYTTSSTGAITYASGKTAVATVSASGLITAVAEGTATITISQAKNETYKSGTATISVTVVDNREPSALALTSEAAVSIEEGEASQITITGAAGAVTYKSSKTSVATVDGTGKITAVAEGTATITITDAGSETVKGGSLTVAVTVTAQPGSGDDDPEDPTANDEVVCHFTGNAISSDMVKKVVGNFSDSRGSVIYNGTTYDICIKMEKSTKITITPAFDCCITLYMLPDPEKTNTKSYLDGKEIAVNAENWYKFMGSKDQEYVLTKKETMNLFLVIFTPAQDMNLTAKVDPQNAGAYYATFFSSLSAYTLPADVTAYIATMDADGQSITLHAIDGDVVPKSEAVLIKASNASVKLTKSDSDASKSQDNVFEGADLETAQAAGKDYYVLSGNATHGVGFYHLAAGNKLGANKAFIAVDASSASPARLNFSFEGEGAESLPAIEQNPDTEVIYGLDGQRRSAQQKGFSIVNGKKVFVM